MIIEFPKKDVWLIDYTLETNQDFGPVSKTKTDRSIWNDNAQVIFIKKKTMHKLWQKGVFGI